MHPQQATQVVELRAFEPVELEHSLRLRHDQVGEHEVRSVVEPSTIVVEPREALVRELTVTVDSEHILQLQRGGLEVGDGLGRNVAIVQRRREVDASGERVGRISRNCTLEELARTLVISPRPGQHTKVVERVRVLPCGQLIVDRFGPIELAARLPDHSLVERAASSEGSRACSCW